MSKKLHIITLLILSCFYLQAQPDCIILFKYKAIITSDSIKIAKIGFPTTPFLIGYISKTKDGAFSMYEPKDSIVNQILASHLSSDFCMDYESIINNVFKKKREGYLIKIFETQSGNPKKYKPLEILIPLDSIKFTSEIIESHKGIIIDLGKIKI